MVLALREPLVPVIVIVALARLALDAVTVRVELVAGAATVTGEKEPFTLEGRPLALRLTVPEKPLARVTVTV